jgi:hypothetical protein
MRAGCIGCVTLTRREVFADAGGVLLAELADFVTRHRPCGGLSGDATEAEPGGYMLSVGCSCGVTFLRWVTPEMAQADIMTWTTSGN